MTADIFSPVQLGNFTLKNRLGVAPMTRMSAGKDSIPRQDVLDFLVRRARNGAAVVFTEAIVTDYESAQGYPGQARILNQSQVEAWKPVTEAIRRHGAVSILQMFHCGRMAWPEINPAARSIAPSALTPRQLNPITGQPYPVPEAMSLFDIEHVVNGFVETAKGALAAGFDGVEIHGAHGYLISQFLSAHTNHRTDEYGGTLANRFRFTRDILRAVRETLPRDRLLTFRISNWGVADMEVSLFKDAREWEELIDLIDSEPIDALSLSTYDFKAKAFGTDRTMAGLTRSRTTKPLMLCGKIHDRATAQQALTETDIVLSAKSILLNPSFVDDVRQGKELPLYSSEEANIAYTTEPLP